MPRKAFSLSYAVFRLSLLTSRNAVSFQPQTIFGFLQPGTTMENIYLAAVYTIVTTINGLRLKTHFLLLQTNLFCLLIWDTGDTPKKNRLFLGLLKRILSFYISSYTSWYNQLLCINPMIMMMTVPTILIKVLVGQRWRWVKGKQLVMFCWHHHRWSTSASAPWRKVFPDIQQIQKHNIVTSEAYFGWVGYFGNRCWWSPSE